MYKNPTPLTWQAVFFDFDGVIADATEVKVQAFAALFATYGQRVQQAVISYHLANCGIPRHQKIRHCFTTFAGQTLTDRELDRAEQTFSHLVLDEMVATSFIPGALTSLQHLHQAAVPAFVVSGTPDDEMRRIIKRKKLGSYFLEVHGSPLTKPVIVTNILVRHGFIPNRCLFIGDALADYRAAQATGMHFLGIVPTGRDSIFPEDIPVSPTVCLDF